MINAKSFTTKANIDTNAPFTITGVRSYTRQNDNQEISIYEIVLPAMGYEKADVSLKGKAIISSDELNSKPAGILAKFNGLELFPSASTREGGNGTYAVISGIAGTATSIKREG